MSSLAQYFPHLVQNATPSQPDTTSQPTTQPQVPDPTPEPPIFTKGKRNSVNFIYKGYRHCGAGKSNSSTYYKCINQLPRCPGRLTLVNQQVTKFTPHTCEIEPAKLAVHLIHHKIKHSAESSSKSTKRVVAESLGEVTDVEVVANLPNLCNLNKQTPQKKDQQ